MALGAFKDFSKREANIVAAWAVDTSLSIVPTGRTEKGESYSYPIADGRSLAVGDLLGSGTSPKAGRGASSFGIRFLSFKKGGNNNLEESF